ncbi:ISL3 family transposase [Actinomadura chokoriensis]|uniref:ISL3 family transposase n=1 Tax=Actinomadura chokoriensis TaxID=454156 RepID=A0ABV4R937_9ACTN
MELCERRDGAVVVQARAKAAAASCSRCEAVSGRRHGWYVRRLQDVAASGCSVRLELRVRRFRCVSSECSVNTFTEQIPGLTRPYARTTTSLRNLLTAIGLALAGRAGVRMAETLGIAVGRDTLLRLVRAIPDPPVGQVQILGVDDFAIRRGHNYGTILIDLGTRRPVDLINGRDGDALAAWLRSRPLPEVICRDRAGGYAEGARQGAPDALQVADRFHLWRNLGQAVEKDVSAARASLAAALAAAVESRRTSDAPTVVNHRELQVVARIRKHHAAVHELLNQGLSKAAIGRRLGLHQATVRKYANATVEEVTAANQQRASILDGYHEHLHRRWNEGIRNATQLIREITALGYRGTAQQVQRYLRRFRPTGTSEVEIPPPRPPAVRDLTRWIMSNPENLDQESTIRFRKMQRLSRDLHRLTRYVKDFAVMLTQLEGQKLDDWITCVEKDSLTAIAGFARNLRRDYDAVRNGLTMSHSSGPVEGHVNRVKMLKRQMFGRAKLDLLRKRTLHAA